MSLALVVACGDGGESRPAETTIKDIIFEEILIPDIPDVGPMPDLDAVDTFDAADTLEAPEVFETQDDADDTDDGPPDIEDTADAADLTGDSADGSDTPGPSCGDEVCSGDESCLSCLDCACPERCGTTLFISEYLEAPTGFGKALEIMNATGRSVALAGYAIWKITNGGDWSEATPLALTGTLAAGQTFVVCHASASPVILGACDLATSQDAMEFNGNDAVALAYQGVIVDAIGQAGPDPGVAFAIGSVADATRDHRLVRQVDIVDGATEWSVGNQQWDVLPYAETGLGMHAVAAACSDDRPAPALLNELRIGSGSADFIEVVAAPGGDGVDLSGWRVAATGGAYVLPSGSAAMIQPGGFRAIPRAESGIALATNDIIWLYDGDGVLRDRVAFDAAALAGRPAWGRLPDYAGAWLPLRLATPGAANADPDHQCDDGTCDADETCDACPADCGLCPPGPGELVISEVLAEPSAGPEWLELVNVTDRVIEVAGVVLADDATDFFVLGGSLPAASIVLGPAEYLVLGSAAAPHVDLVYTGFRLDAAGDVVKVLSDGDLVDRVSWKLTPTSAGVAWSLDPTALDAAANDDDAAWCAATSGGPDGQLGTPGLANPSCTPPSCPDTECDPDETCVTCPADCGVCPASCATGLYISEYVEGESGSNKKAIEIANFTGAPVNLGDYALKKIANGGAWTDAVTLVLSGTLAHGEVWVVCAAASIPDVLARCDVTTGSQVMTFNGNDAVALSHGATIIDSVGTESPPNPVAWTVAGVAKATEDHVLVRLPAVDGPTTDWTTSAASQWSVLPPGQYQGLGAHVTNATCQP